jgi:hypothetical protein
MTTIGIIPNKEDIEKNDTNKRQEVEGCTADENSWGVGERRMNQLYSNKPLSIHSPMYHSLLSFSSALFTL